MELDLVFAHKVGRDAIRKLPLQSWSSLRAKEVEQVQQQLDEAAKANAAQTADVPLFVFQALVGDFQSSYARGQGGGSRGSRERGGQD